MLGMKQLITLNICRKMRIQSKPQKLENCIFGTYGYKKKEHGMFYCTFWIDYATSDIGLSQSNALLTHSNAREWSRPAADTQP